MTYSTDWSAYVPGALVETFSDAFIVAGARTPFVDYNGALGLVSATDLGIHAARAALARSGLEGKRLGTTIAGSCAQTSFDAFFYPRHVGLFAGMANDRPALGVNRLCTTGFEAIAQAARGVSMGQYEAALAVGAESMSRNPVAAYTHRGGFRMGQVEFKDFLWESLFDTAGGCGMGQTAENLAQAYGIDRATTDTYAARSFARALAAVEAGRFSEEIAPVTNAEFAADGLKPRDIAGVEGVAGGERREDAPQRAHDHPHAGHVERPDRRHRQHVAGIGLNVGVTTGVDIAKAAVQRLGRLFQAEEPRSFEIAR